MHKGRIYVTEDYYGGIRLSAVNTNATNTDGSGSIFQNTGRGSGDIELDDARELVRRWNAFEQDGSHTELLAACKGMVKFCYPQGNWRGYTNMKCLLDMIQPLRDAIAAAEAVK